MSDEFDPVLGVDPIELETAFAWTCPMCKRRNFAESELFEFSDEDERRDVLLEVGLIEAWQDTPSEKEGGFRVSPDIVVCAGCGSNFPTIDPDPDLDEGDDEDGNVPIYSPN